MEPLRSVGSGNTILLNIQVGAAITGAPGDTNDAGIVSFDDTFFSVDADGYVSLIGSIGGVQTLTGDDAVAISPDGGGDLDLIGNTVANGTNTKPVYFDGDAASNTQNLEVQLSIASGASNSLNAGLASFDNNLFTVDSAGFVSSDGTMIGQTITGDSGGALSPTAGNWNIISTATNGIDTSGAGSNLTIGMATPYSDGDFEFRSAVSGQTRQLLISNTSDTASSQSQITTSVAGSSAGDTWIEHAVGSSRAYAYGIDNDDSDKFKFTTAAAATANPSTANPAYTFTPGTGFNYDLAGTTSLGIGVGLDPTATLPLSIQKDQNDLTGISVFNRHNTAAETLVEGKISINCQLTGGELTEGGIALGNDISDLVGGLGTTVQNRLVLFSNSEVDGITIKAGKNTTGDLEFRTGDGTEEGQVVGTVSNAGQWAFPLLPLEVSSGGTGVNTLTDGGILLGSGSADVTVTAQPTNGQLLIGSTGVDPVLGTLTDPAAGLTITEGAGSITFALADDLAALEGLSGTGLVTRTAADTYTERTITGTASRISVTNGNGISGNPTLDIDAAYVGQASITTLGTITTGTWNGTTIAVANGGTGAATLTGVLTGNGTGAVTANAVTNGAVLLGGASNAVTDTGVLAKGVILVGDGAGAPTELAVGADDQVLTADSAEASGVKWAAAGAASDTNAIKEYWFAAESLQPLETNFAPLEKLEGTNVNVFVRAFDDTTEEYANGKLQVPGDVDTGGTVTFRIYVMSKTAVASKNTAWTFGHLALNNGEDFDPASPYTDEDSGDKAMNDTQDNLTEITWTETISNMSWIANDIVLFRLSRYDASANDLAGDCYLFSMAVEIPRS